MEYFFPHLFKPKIVRMWPPSEKILKKEIIGKDDKYYSQKEKKERERNSRSVKYRNKVSE